MDYNELKAIILRTLSDGGLMSGDAVGNRLVGVGVRVEIHAVRMALMRYYKQGLLRRERLSGIYSYALSERGVRRLAWLESVKRTK